MDLRSVLYSFTGSSKLASAELGMLVIHQIIGFLQSSKRHFDTGLIEITRDDNFTTLLPPPA